MMPFRSKCFYQSIPFHSTKNQNQCTTLNSSLAKCPRSIQIPFRKYSSTFHKVFGYFLVSNQILLQSIQIPLAKYSSTSCKVLKYFYQVFKYLFQSIQVLLEKYSSTSCKVLKYFCQVFIYFVQSIQVLSANTPVHFGSIWVLCK